MQIREYLRGYAKYWGIQKAFGISDKYIVPAAAGFVLVDLSPLIVIAIAWITS